MKYILVLHLLSLVAMDNCNNSKPTNTTSVISFDLEYKIREPKDLHTSCPVLVLLHGYGSNEDDLFPFANSIPENWLVVTLRAPIALGPNQYKWYNVEMVNDKITMNFEDQQNSQTQILKFIDQLATKYRVDKNKIVTAGFSQGANMAVGLTLTNPDKILAAGCFSGRFMEEIKPLINNSDKLQGRQVFIAHGTQDKMLPLSYAEENQNILKSYGIEVTQSLDQVAHSISKKQFQDFVVWLRDL